MRRSLVGSAVLAVAVGAAAASPGLVGAAPNPLGDDERSSTVLLADDGSYTVTTDWRQELFDDDYDLIFEIAVHDGFRLPDDDESPIPPYLRAEYETRDAEFDGDSVDAEWKAEGHRLSASFGGDVAEGEHEGSLRYLVRGAAVKTDGGFRVYLRGGELGRITVDPSKLTGTVTDVRCHYRPIATPCGDVGSEGERIVVEPAEVVVIDVRGAADQIAPPVIDRG